METFWKSSEANKSQEHTRDFQIGCQPGGMQKGFNELGLDNDMIVTESNLVKG